MQRYSLEQFCKEECTLFSSVLDLRQPRTPNRAKRNALYSKYADKLVVNPHLKRNLVSFQADKNKPIYRWFKYKEAFSSDLVRWLLHRCGPHSESKTRVLDPFAGAGTAVAAAAAAGCEATGIELLPVATAALRARLAAQKAAPKSFQHYLRKLEGLSLGSPSVSGFRFPHLRITRMAFPQETEETISAYMSYVDKIGNQDIKELFWFASLSCLEEVSYTRKDGQYLRWDSRSGKSSRSKFNKGHIPDFRTAVTRKLWAMLNDIKSRRGGKFAENVTVVQGSCLSELPLLADGSFDLVITSPPYCNRYDYTRTYALELAFMGNDEEAVKNLRQALLSATVENKSKRVELARAYARRNQQQRYRAALQAFEAQDALQEVLRLLYKAREAGSLNNSNIPNMVENYFFEINLVIHELARVLAPGGRIAMVNDNVQYNGQEVPVDLILSDLASSAGLTVECIWVLPRGKGNSSQQMSVLGRNELRKCVYVWSKPAGV